MANLRYTSSYETVSHIISDLGDFLWIAYEKNSAGVVHLQKVYITALDQVVFDISITGVNEVLDMAVGNSYVHLLYDNASTYAGQAYKMTSPSFDRIDYVRPAGAPTYEEPVSCCYYSNFDYFSVLYPGDSSAENALVYNYGTDGSFQEAIGIRIDDIKIVDAKSIVADTNDEMWIVTHTYPIKLIRMFYESGALWKFMFTNMSGGVW